MSSETTVTQLGPDVFLCKEGPFGFLVKKRCLTEQEFIDQHASGTLRKNKRLGFRTREHYLHERASFEFGAGWECLPVSRVRWGDPLSEPDVKPVTEAGWFADRYIHCCLFPGDRVEVKSIEVEYKDGTTKQGIGMVMRETSAAWVPPGHLVFVIISEWNTVTKSYADAINPS